jgi:hypothetical protein
MKQIYDNKDIGETIDKSFDAGIKEGYRRCMEQMMEKAVEGVAHPDDCEIWVNLVGYGSNIKDGDKVRVIIVRED